MHRSALVPVLLALACAAPSDRPTQVPPTSGDTPAPTAADAEPATAETPAPATTPEPVGERWTFTTLVSGGPAALVGANGYYELIVDGEQVRVRKIGERGTPQFDEAHVLEGTGTLTLASDPLWPGVKEGSLSLKLTNASTERTIDLQLWFLGTELHGNWTFGTGSANPGNVRGLLAGERDGTAGRDVLNGNGSPCWVCVQAFWDCEGMGVGACNSSNLAVEACDERVAKARAKGKALPRGCGESP
jgi:hypothetical protein